MSQEFADKGRAGFSIPVTNAIFHRKQQ